MPKAKIGQLPLLPAFSLYNNFPIQVVEAPYFALIPRLKNTLFKFSDLVIKTAAEIKLHS